MATEAVSHDIAVNEGFVISPVANGNAANPETDTAAVSRDIAVNEGFVMTTVANGNVANQGTDTAQDSHNVIVQEKMTMCKPVLPDNAHVQEVEQPPVLTMKVSHDNAVHTVLGIYRPKSGFTADEVLESTIKHYGAVEEIKEFLIAAIIRSLDGAYAGSYAHWKKGTDIVAVFHLPGLVPMLTEMGALADIEPVEVEVLANKEQLDQPPILSKGAILHIALLSTEPENQSQLIEALRMTIKQQTGGIQGLNSVTIHRALDGKKVVVISAWEDTEIAKSAVNSPIWEYSGTTFDQYIVARDIKLYEVVLVR